MRDEFPRSKLHAHLLIQSDSARHLGARDLSVGFELNPCSSSLHMGGDARDGGDTRGAIMLSVDLASFCDSHARIWCIMSWCDSPRSTSSLVVISNNVERPRDAAVLFIFAPATKD